MSALTPVLYVCVFPMAAVPDSSARAGGARGGEEGGEGQQQTSSAAPHVPGGLGQERRHGGLLPAGGATTAFLQGTALLHTSIHATFINKLPF